MAAMMNIQVSGQISEENHKEASSNLQIVAGRENKSNTENVRAYANADL